MEYVKLGRTGLEVSRICLGCMSYGVPGQGNHAWSIDEVESRPFIQKALEGGINFFDTAAVCCRRQSSPHTWRIARSIATSSTIEDAIRFRGTSERRAKMQAVA